MFHYKAKNYRCQTVDEYFGHPFAVRLLSVCCPIYRTTNVPVHYLCTGTFVHKSSTKHSCTNG